MGVLEIIVYLGGGAALAASFVYFLGNFLAERMADKLKIKWSGEQEKKLEQLRAEITREHSTFTAILNSYSSSHQFSQSDRIKAVQTLWGNILKTRNIGSFPSFFFDVLLENEYNTIEKDAPLMSKLNSLSFNKTVEEIGQIIESVENYRPFLGEHLWSLFKLYTILVSRTSILLIKGRDNKDIKSWHKDEYIQSILNEIFDEKEMQSINSGIIVSFEVATELLEQKILFEMFKIISGELAAESNLSKAKKLQELIGQEKSQ